MPRAPAIPAFQHTFIISPQTENTIPVLRYRKLLYHIPRLWGTIFFIYLEMIKIPDNQKRENRDYI